MTGWFLSNSFQARPVAHFSGSGGIGHSEIPEQQVAATACVGEGRRWPLCIRALEAHLGGRDSSRITALPKPTLACALWA
jgi:hypothetical protein